MKTIKSNGIYSLTVIFCLAITLIFALCSESAAFYATQSQHVFISPFSHAFGFSVSSAGDFNGDGIDDLIVGAPEVPPQEAQAYIFYGKDPSDPVLERLIFLHNANVVLTGPSSAHPIGVGSLFGRSVAGGGDFNDDGYDDVIVGATHAGSSNETYEGCVYVFFGQEHSRYDDRLTIPFTSANLTICGQNNLDMFGFAVAMVGKLNDDHMDDIAIGAPLHSDDWYNGRIYIINGFDPLVDRLVVGVEDIWSADFPGTGMLGWSLAGIGDFDNNGYNDFAVGLPELLSNYDDPDRFIAGYVLVYSLIPEPATPLYPQGTYEVNHTFGFRGSQAGGGFGLSVAPAGDVNQDGFDDLIVGAPDMDSQHGQEDVGLAYIILGRTVSDDLPGALAMWSPDEPFDFPSGVIQIHGERAMDRFGRSVSKAGDFNGDGFDDVIIGASRDLWFGGDLEGRAYVFAGREMNNDDFANIYAGEEGMTIVGEEPEDHFGFSVAGGFGWTPEGFINTFIGAPGYGSVYLFRSSFSPYPLHISFPISLQNNTDKIAKGSPFFQKSIDQGTIGFYFTEPNGGSEQNPKLWGEVPFDANVPPGKSVTLAIPWPTCSQVLPNKEAACSQPSYEASLFWTFKATIDGKLLYAFPANTQNPEEPQAPPLLSLASEGAGENKFELFAFGDDTIPVGGAKAFNLMSAVANVAIKPQVLNLKSRGGRIQCTIDLPDGLRERDIEPDSLLLSDPSCQACQPIKALRGYATKKKYTAFFARKDLIDLIKIQQEENDHLLLKLSGHLKFGNFFEGDIAIHLKRGSKKKKLAKK